MQIVVLVAFVVVLALLDAPSLEAPAWAFAPAVGVYFAAAAALTALNVRMSLRGVRRASGLSPAALRRHNALAAATQVWLVGGLAGLILMGFGQWVTVVLKLGRVPLLATLAALAPFLVAVVVMWLLDYPFHRAVRRRIAEWDAGAPGACGWSRWEYLAYNVRHHLLFVAVPVGLIVLVQDLLRLYAYERMPEPVRDYVYAAGMAVAAGSIFFFAPFLVVRIWRTRPLEPGRLRDTLQAVADRLKLRFRGLLVWLSGGIIANAGVMGLVGKVRYVLLSDGLLQRMEDRHVKAIFAHEAGHITSHHIFYSLLFALSSVLLCQTLVGWVAEAAGWSAWTGQILALPALVVIWGFGFGWLSRRFERQSDVIAAWVVSRPLEELDADSPITEEGAAVFTQALERVAELNGIAAHQRNWRHGSIARRVSHVLHLAATRRGRQDIDRLVRRIKMALWCAMAAAIAAVVAGFALTG